MHRVPFLVLVLLFAIAPGAAAQPVWEAMEAPAGGTVNALAFDGTDVVYAGTWGAGVFRSADGGATWEAAGLLGLSVRDLVLDADGAVYAGLYCGDVDGRCLDEAAQGGVHVSRDGGSTWAPLLQDDPEDEAPFSRVHDLAWSDDGHLLAATFGAGLAAAPPGHAVLTATDLAPTDVRAVASGHGRLYAATKDEGIYAAEEGVRGWRLVAGADVLGLARAAVPGPDGLLYVAAWTGGTDDPGGGVFRGDPAAGTWTRLDAGEAHSRPWSLAFGPDGTLWCGTHGGGVRRLRPGAGRWEQTGLDGRVVGRVAVDPAGRVWAGTQSGLYRREGDAWTLVGVPSSVVYALAAQDDAFFAGTEGGGVFRSDDDGVTWRPTALAEETVVTLTTAPSGRLWAATTTGRVYYTDDGHTWRLTSRDGEDDPITVRVQSLFAAADGTVWAGTLTGEVYTSADGETWRRTPRTGRQVEAFTPALDGGLLMAELDGLYHTADGGATWTLRSHVGGAGLLDLHRAPDGTLVIATLVGVFRSDDDGWTYALDGLEGRIVLELLRADGRLWAATYGDGVYVLEDDGWRRGGTGLDRPHVLSLGVTPRGHLAAGTDGFGVYRSTAPVVVATAPTQPLPAQALLQAAYPNPARGGTTITFELAAAGPVRLAVYDARGAEVAVLARGVLPAGRHEVAWEPGPAASGVYFYRLEAGGRTATRALTLVR